MAEGRGARDIDHSESEKRAAAQRNINAMTARNSPRGGLMAGMNPLHYSRRTPNVTPSYEMSLHNMFELGKFATGLMGGGLGTMAALGKLAAGFGPDFQGFTGNQMGPGDMDPTNRAGMGLLARMGTRAGRGLQRGY